MQATGEKAVKQLKKMLLQDNQSKSQFYFLFCWDLGSEIWDLLKRNKNVIQKFVVSKPKYRVFDINHLAIKPLREYTRESHYYFIFQYKT